MLNFSSYRISECYNRIGVVPSFASSDDAQCRLIITTNISVVLLYWVLKVVFLRVRVIIAN
jgi:hypothetical protein